MTKRVINALMLLTSAVVIVSCRNADENIEVVQAVLQSGKNEVHLKKGELGKYYSKELSADSVRMVIHAEILNELHERYALCDETLYGYYQNPFHMASDRRVASTDSVVIVATCIVDGDSLKSYFLVSRRKVLSIAPITKGDIIVGWL